MKADGPPGASSNGFNENLALFNDGKCGMWIDATVAAGFVTGQDSKVADKVGFALAPGQRSGQARQLAVGMVARHPCRHEQGRRGEKFISWATEQAVHRSRRLEGGLGERSAGHAHLALQERGLSEGGAVGRR